MHQNKMSMSENRKNYSHEAWTNALSSLFEDEYPEHRFRIPVHEIDALEGLPPDKWPTAGQPKINWDLSVQGREFTMDLPCSLVLQPADCADADIGAMVLGKVKFSDFDPLLHPHFCMTDSDLWDGLDPFKLGRAVLHIAKGWPVSPVHLCVHEDGGFFFGGGTHRYEVLKRTGTSYMYFLAKPVDVINIETRLSVQWLSHCV
ncbi:hypothetical protein [Citrobacter braakii]|uniref:hypothetical protein n=1 Tax=Citrobacter braakii TaxID=57706 RepID=UPI002DBCB8E3|nr:hypothetical protein [Citrobacter braakii]MEB8160717.1 hypothetical protein [Citrobacter braakii]